MHPWTFYRLYCSMTTCIILISLGAISPSLACYRTIENGKFTPTHINLTIIKFDLHYIPFKYFLTSAQNTSSANALKQLITACWTSIPSPSNTLVMESRRCLGCLAQNKRIFRTCHHIMQSESKLIIHICMIQALK